MLSNQFQFLPTSFAFRNNRKLHPRNHHCPQLVHNDFSYGNFCIHLPHRASSEHQRQVCNAGNQGFEKLHRILNSNFKKIINCRPIRSLYLLQFKRQWLICQKFHFANSDEYLWLQMLWLGNRRRLRRVYVNIWKSKWLYIKQIYVVAFRGSRHYFFKGKGKQAIYAHHVQERDWRPSLHLGVRSRSWRGYW